MAVTIRPMIQREFEQFYDWSVEHQAQELMTQLHISKEDAVMNAIAEITQMLTHGLHTKHHYLMTILEDGGEETAGFIWTLHEEFEGKQQSFLCDFVIWESYRRKGYATAALHLAERHAAEAGCCESVLFVSDDNEAARSLYQKNGYQVLRQKDYGKFMIKQLSCTRPESHKGE